MANEINPKLVAQLLDLNRSIDKLTSEVKKSNTTSQNSKDDGNIGKTQETGDKIAPILDSISKDLKKLNSQIEKIDFDKIAGISEVFDPKAIKEAISNPLSAIFGKGEKGDAKGIFGKVGNILSGNKILGKFQTGGVADKDGKYLVGENGPEVVKLPSGSAVIPINIKDLIEGIAKVPELANLAKNGEINAYGNSDNPSVLLGKASDVKNRISLTKLSEKYEDALDDQDSLDEKDKDPLEMKKLKEQNAVISNLMDLVEKNVSNNIDKISSDQIKLLSDKFPKGLNQEQHTFLEKTWDAILNKLPEGERNYLTVAKARLLATNMLLENINKPKEADGKAEIKTIPDNLKDLSKPPEKTKDTTGILKTPLGKTKATVIEEKTTLGKEASSNETATPNLATPGISGDSSVESLMGGNLPDLIKNIPNLLKGGIPKISGLNIGKVMGKINTPEFKKSITSLNSVVPKKGIDLGNEFKSLNTSLTNMVKPQVESIKEKAKDFIGDKVGKIGGKSDDSTKKEESKDKTSKGMDADLADIKYLLSRIAMSLDGPLEVSPIDHPFRPDTRKI